MGSVAGDWDEEYSFVGDKVDVGFLDYEKDQSLHSFDPLEDGPITISIPFAFVNGKPRSALVGETSADLISIKNTTDDPIDLWSVRIFSSNPEDSYLLSLMKPPQDFSNEETARGFVGSTVLDERVVQPCETLTIWLSCRAKQIGLHTSVVHFDVGDEKIERVAFLLVDDQVSQALFSNKPYVRATSRGRKFNHDQYVSGHRPSRTMTQQFRYKLPQYPIPPDVREMVENKQVPDVIMEGLNNANYGRYFGTLISMEEIHLEGEMRAHNMDGMTMKRRGNHFLSLEVPGLSERRPSLFCGDYILAQPMDEGSDCITSQPYQGFIHRVEADEIFLRFDKSLHLRHRDDALYCVSFTYNRLNMRRLYQAVYAAENLGRELLFPSGFRRVIIGCPFQPVNTLLNREQEQCVQKILGCRGSPPYIIHGPPGTGKTMTLVEGILQIYTTRRKAHILVCASSNSAADHILEKLLSSQVVRVKENEIFRLNAASRPYRDINPDHLRFCFFEEMVFKCPPLRALLRYKIIISTYMSASYLYAEGIFKGHFSHIFLDEAGQASEPETMVPVSNLLIGETVVVLAGDPMQLGPVIYSRNAESYGLGKSYLERLFECEHYRDEDENYVTKLVRNYRCHPAILELPSNLFYKGELVACKEGNESLLYDWEELPNKTFPVLFWGIQGCDEREGNNPSWFNRIEVSKVVDIIRKLMRNTDVTEGDIGVITPYRQQVFKLKKSLESLEIADLKVGSVEQFQGQERRVIIVSTVRSTVKHNDFDLVHNLGFVSNPRRFNVSVTRAKSLLIIVGNPHIITQDPHWDKLLRYCAEHGSYQGCPLPPPSKHDYFDQSTQYGGRKEFQNTNCNKSGWNEDAQNQYCNSTEWYQDTPKQYSNDVEWDEDTSYLYDNEAEWGNGTLNCYTNNAECHNNMTELNDDASKTWSNEAGWGGDDALKYRSNDSEWGDDISKKDLDHFSTVSIPKASNFGWGGDDASTTSYNDAKWGDDESKPCSTRTYCGMKDPDDCLMVNIPRNSNFGWGDDDSSKSYSTGPGSGGDILKPHSTRAHRGKKGLKHSSRKSKDHVKIPQASNFGWND